MDMSDFTVEMIRDYQKKLMEKGFYCIIDGVYGPKTRNAVKDFQISKRIDDDGLIGKRTHPLLME